MLIPFYERTEQMQLSQSSFAFDIQNGKSLKLIRVSATANNLKNRILPEHMENDYSTFSKFLNDFKLKISSVGGDNCKIMEIL